MLCPFMLNQQGASTELCFAEFGKKNLKRSCFRGYTIPHIPLQCEHLRNGKNQRCSVVTFMFYHYSVVVSTSLGFRYFCCYSVYIRPFPFFSPSFLGRSKVMRTLTSARLSPFFPSLSATFQKRISRFSFKRFQFCHTIRCHIKYFPWPYRFYSGEFTKQVNKSRGIFGNMLP